MDETSPINFSVIFLINEEITPRKNLDELYDSIVSIATRVIKSEASSLLLYNKDDHQLYFKSTTDEGMNRMLGERIPSNSGIAWEVFKTRKTLMINNAVSDIHFFDGVDKATGFNTRNLICVPMMARDEFVGVLEVVNSNSAESFTDTDVSLAEIIAMISAHAITGRMLYDDLKKRVEELNALFELSRAASLAESDTDFFHRAITILSNSLQVERGSLILYNEKTGRLEIAAIHGSAIPVGSPVPEDSVASYVFKTGEPMNVRDVRTDIPEWLKKKQAAYSSHAFVSVPVYYNNSIIGVINLTDKTNRRLFDEFELHVLSALGTHIAGVYRTYVDRRDEERRRKLKQELDIASEIQRRNLARIPNVFCNMNISVLYEPAKEIGGDFYDFFVIDSNRCGLLVADVAGKGIPAALFTGTVRNIIKFGIQNDPTPAKLLHGSNLFIVDESEYGMFVTVFYTLIDTASKTITYSSAGHNEQVLVKRSSGEIKLLNVSGKPLGIVKNAAFTETSVNYEPGDLLLLFTDGLVESLGDDGEDLDLGYEKISDILKNNINQPAEIILNILRNAIRDNSPGNELMDDLTVIAVNL